MNERVPNWSDLERRDAQPPEKTEARRTFEELCAHVFTTPHGRDLMAALRKHTIERRTPAGSTEAMLREIEAERRFVANLEAARDAGLEALKAKHSAT